ncbi:MAG: FkbM family methyltransferase [Acidobacteria bacterium]|nr:FkbM family methyltransferase [Acidobacteriota bacterium]
MPGHHPIFQKFSRWQGTAPPGYRINFLGVKTRNAYFTQWGSARRSTTDYPDFDEEYFEWIDVLEAVAQAEGRFTMLELGAGFGCWLANAAAALQQSKKLPYTLVGVEAEPTHFQWMIEHLRSNEVDLSRCQLVQAAVTAFDGRVGFHVGQTVHGGPANWYGQSVGGPVEVNAVSLSALLRPFDRVDLVDLDVQGIEFEVLQAAAEAIDKKVKRLHIATHTREIEAALRSLFQGLSWTSVHDYPCADQQPVQNHATDWGIIGFQDGVQSWVNPKMETTE